MFWEGGGVPYHWEGGHRTGNREHSRGHTHTHKNVYTCIHVELEYPWYCFSALQSAAQLRNHFFSPSPCSPWLFQHLRKQPTCIQSLVHNLHHVVGGFWDWNKLFRDPEHERQHLAMLLGFLVAVAAPWWILTMHYNRVSLDPNEMFGDGDLGTALDFGMILGHWSRLVKITSASKT